MTDSPFIAVWDSPRFRQLLASGKPGAALALVRKQMGLSQADFAELLHWDRTHAGRVERGEVGTIFDVRELIRAADALGIPRSALLPLLLGDADAGTIEGGGGEGVDDVDRRQFVQTATLAVTAGVAADVPWSGPMRVGTGHIAYLEKVTQQLWEHDNVYGGARIADFAVQQYRLARRLVDHGEYGSRIGADLIDATCRLAGLAGWVAEDSGWVDLARRFYTEAVLLAEQCGEEELLEDAIANMSFLATERPASREPVRLAQRASELARRIPSARLNALRAAREAVAHAAVGEQREFEQTMTRAWREVDRGLDDSEDAIWLHFVTPTEIRSIEARGRSYLGQHRRAAIVYHEAVSGGGSMPLRDEASYRAYFAASLAGLGDLSTAIAEGHAALSLLEGPVSSPRLVEELRPVRVGVSRLRGDDAEYFRRRFDSLCGAATGHGGSFRST
ncbi:helix-turn-helix transcriptional regulator [Nocardia sp. NPDC051787]|uniref:helix-turn-helix domain-containing protein n=1 Tax=Nocardia sp. NPDC051787 TaxID=3155415 RepID=UPI00341D3D9E